MRFVTLPILCALYLGPGCMTGWSKGLLLTNVTVGVNLETAVRISLEEPAPDGGLQISVTSSDPSRARLSTAPNQAGSASINLMVREGFRVSPEFHIQGLAHDGSVAYRASAPGTSGEATVTLTPSFIVIGGPFGTGKPSFLATSGSTFPIGVYSVILAPSGNYIPQPIAGGSTVNVRISSSNESVGTVTTREVAIIGGSDRTTTQFQPAAQGNTNLTASIPPGFSNPPEFGSITAVVKLPGIGVTEGVAIGQNLQIGANVSLGTMARDGGVRVTLSSNDPERLLLAPSPIAKGCGEITITIPEGHNSGLYYLHALGSSGTATYSAKSPGFLSRTGTIYLAPSGLVVVGPLTLPEGQLLRANAAGGARQHGFVTSLKAGVRTTLSVYAVQLDPATHRSADISVQALRAGVSVTVNLKSANTGVGIVGSPITIAAGSDHGMTEFTPLATGSTVISLVTPDGFVQSSNDTTLRAIVTQ